VIRTISKNGSTKIIQILLSFMAERFLMNANGPAIKGGCVTRHKHRLNPGTLATRLSRCKEGIAHFLPSGYRVLWHLRASWYRVVKELVNYPDAVKFIEGSGAPAPCEQSE
jgi:hypothetical protein